MTVTIELSEKNAAALESQARAAQAPIERYIADVVERALESQHRRDVANLDDHLNHMASQVVPGVSPDEMESALVDALASVRPLRNWLR